MRDDYYLLINEVLGVTADHLLLLSDDRWISAGDLRIGDMFTSGKTVDSIEYVPGRVWTYNLETVGDNHNFVVSLGGGEFVVAHNGRTYVTGGYDESSGQNDAVSLATIEYSAMLNIYKINAIKSISAEVLKEDFFNLQSDVYFRIRITSLDGLETILDYGSSEMSPLDASVVASQKENVVIVDPIYGSYVYAVSEVLVYS